MILMATNLEIEFKNMLTEQEYQQLLYKFSINEEQLWTQKNVYFDTPTGQLKKLEAALRIRVKNSTYELTLKTKQAVGLLETNQMITKQDYQALKYDKVLVKGPVYEALQSLSVDVNHLLVITDLTTKRAEVPYKEGLLVLDKSFYSDVIDYELEYEVTDYEVGLRHFNDLLKQYHIPTRETENKIKRATNAMNKKKN